MSHILQHVAKLCHGNSCLLEDLATSVIVQIELVYLLSVSIYVSLVLLNF